MIKEAGYDSEIDTHEDMIAVTKRVIREKYNREITDKEAEDLMDALAKYFILLAKAAKGMEL